MLPTSYDGIERLHNYRLSAEYPLMFAAALSKDDILANWWRVTVRECVAVAAMLLSICAVGYCLETALRDAHAALEQRNAVLDRLPIRMG
jgi:hypothetical protein